MQVRCQGRDQEVEPVDATLHVTLPCKVAQDQGKGRPDPYHGDYRQANSGNDAELDGNQHEQALDEKITIFGNKFSAQQPSDERRVAYADADQDR